MSNSKDSATPMGEKRLKRERKPQDKTPSRGAQLEQAEGDAADEPPRSKKRKRDILPDELEIDIHLPEPPSKKAARKANKAKTAPVPAVGTPKAVASNADVREHEGKRSDFGVWVGNLPWSATKHSLKTFLTANSDIAEEDISRIHMPVPKAPPRPNWTSDKPQNKGFAYVDFATQLAMCTAIALTETKLDGRALLIKNAKSFEGRPEKPKPEEAADTPADRAKGKPGVAKAPSKKVFVGNLAFETSKEQLEEYYGQCGHVEDVHMATFEDSGKCKGFAWVTFEEIEAATAAVVGFVRKTGDDGKRRKWRLGRLMGRDLRCEFAEDGTMRYQKRFGKKGSEGGVQGIVEHGPKGDAIHPSRRNRSSEESNKFSRPRNKVDPRTIAPGAAHAQAPRASAAIVESKGKKTTFD